MTRRCPLACRHCRAEADNAVVRDGELTTAEGKAFIDDLAATCKGLLILTGGEPMLRPDFLELAAYAHAAGLRVVAAVCGMLVTAENAAAMRQAGIMAVSLSIDGIDAQTHDALRGQVGAFDQVCTAAGMLRAAGMPFQVNTTVHTGNADQLPAIRQLAGDLGAATWDMFLLVPTGRAKNLAASALTGQAYESVLHWAAQQAATPGPAVKVTCAPRYVPIAAEYGIEGRGCLGGRAFAFLGATGTVQMCGFMPEAAGDIRDARFSEIWKESPLFKTLRDPDQLTGACGRCGHRATCGGCRARAMADGDMLGADPCCPLATDGGAA
jgi:radical SAM protein with 4Fe4S-binding SPASM domain